jgi:hypothetical protein
MRFSPRELGADALSVSVRNVVDSGEAARRLGREEVSVVRKRQVSGQSPAEPHDEEPLRYGQPEPQAVKKSVVGLSLVIHLTQMVSWHSRKRIGEHLPKFAYSTKAAPE